MTVRDGPESAHNHRYFAGIPNRADQPGRTFRYRQQYAATITPDGVGIVAIGRADRRGARGRVLESKAAWYRGRAADCAKLAATAPTPEAKAMLERMAERWLRLAELVEKSKEK